MNWMRIFSKNPPSIEDAPEVNASELFQLVRSRPTTIAIVGESGSGKSYLLQDLFRLALTQKGAGAHIAQSIEGHQVSFGDPNIRDSVDIHFCGPFRNARDFWWKMYGCVRSLYSSRGIELPHFMAQEEIFDYLLQVMETTVETRSLLLLDGVEHIMDDPSIKSFVARLPTRLTPRFRLVLTADEKLTQLLVQDGPSMIVRSRALAGNKRTKRMEEITSQLAENPVAFVQSSNISTESHLPSEQELKQILRDRINPYMNLKSSEYPRLFNLICYSNCLELIAPHTKTPITWNDWWLETLSSDLQQEQLLICQSVVENWLNWLEKVYPRYLVESICELLCASNIGLSLSEIKNWLCLQSTSELPYGAVPPESWRGFWASLYCLCCAWEGSELHGDLNEKTALIFNPTLREIIWRRYQSGSNLAKNTKALISLLENSLGSAEHDLEFCSQFVKIEAWDRLHQTLHNLSILQRLWKFNPFEVLQLWKSLQAARPETALSAYGFVVEAPTLYETLLTPVKHICLSLDLSSHAMHLTIHEYQAAQIKQDADKWMENLEELSTKAEQLLANGDFQSAESAFLHLQTIGQQLNLSELIQQSLEKRAESIIMGYRNGDRNFGQARLYEALILLDRQAAFCISIVKSVIAFAPEKDLKETAKVMREFPLVHLRKKISNQCAYRGDLSNLKDSNERLSLPPLDKIEFVGEWGKEGLLFWECLVSSHYWQARAWESLDKKSETFVAECLAFEESAKIFRLFKRHPKFMMTSLSSALGSGEDVIEPKQLKQLWEQVSNYLPQRGEAAHFYRAKYNYAAFLLKCGEPENCLRQLDIIETPEFLVDDLIFEPKLLRAKALAELGQWPEVVKSCNQATQLAIEKGWNRECVPFLLLKARSLIYFDSENYPTAIQLVDEAIHLSKQDKNTPYLMECLGQLSDYLGASANNERNFRAAWNALEELRVLSRSRGNKNLLGKCFEKQAELCLEEGKSAEAEQLYQLSRAMTNRSSFLA